MIDEQETYIHRKRKRKKRRIWTALAGALLPVLLVALCVVLLGSGLGAAFSVFGGFLSGLTGKKGFASSEETERIHGMSIDEVLSLVKSGQIDESFYNMMFISRDELIYLLEQVKAYNEQQVRRDIEIECRHEYVEWVEDETEPEGGHYETVIEYPYRTVSVDSAEIENFYLDWQLVYALCLTDTMNGVEGWKRVSKPGESVTDSENAVSGNGEIEHYGDAREEIDGIIENVKMRYEYITDLARDPKSRYTLSECESLVHTTYEYGDPDTEEGSWLYYLPHSVLGRAYSGYSCMYYIISPDGNTLVRLVSSSDMEHFERIIERFCKKYNFGYFTYLLNFIPGGPKLSKSLALYYEHAEDGYLIWDEPLDGYEIGGGIDRELLPVSREVLSNDFGDFTDYKDLAFDESIGGSIVGEAVSKIGCAYDMDHRWEEGIYDCSSFVWRILKAVGIDLSEICAGTTAAEECRGMVNAGMMVRMDEIRQGDIIFYSSGANGRYRNITHTAIYAGDGKIVHARGKAYGVQMGNFYKSGLVCVCRPYRKGDGV